MSGPHKWIWLWVLCAAVYTVSAPGRITFPDDEIVFQTTESLWERGELSIAGMSKKTGEPKGRPDGSFGWDYGRDGQRYGFFGHGVSVVALPMYALGSAAVELLPTAWWHAPRRDLFAFHPRSEKADATRLFASLTNCFVTAFASVYLAIWIGLLGFTRRAALITALAYAFGTAAWPYTSTLLSEPLSALCMLVVACRVTRFHRSRRAKDLWLAGLVAGLSVHVHLLNFLALPCILVWACAPLYREGKLASHRASWGGAILAGGLGIALLAYGQWWRFGSPFETGRFGHYGQWTWPFEALVAQLISPGRSLFLSSPAILLGLLGWRFTKKRVPDAFWFCVAMLVLRWAFVSTRTDWYGGWGIGPRYLVAVLPFAVLPIAGLVDRAYAQASGLRRWWLMGLAACILFEGWLAIHAIFEHMWTLMGEHGVPEYFAVSHWSPGATPSLGFLRLEQPALASLAAGKWSEVFALAKFDMLGFGAMRLARAGHWGMSLAVIALLFAAALAVHRLRRPATS